MVTGGAGNLGGHLIRILLSRGAAVSCFDLSEYTGTDHDKVISVIGDICSPQALVAAMEGVHVVFHVASVIDIRPVPPPSMWQINVDGTAAVVAACNSAHVDTLIYTSSLEVVSGCDKNGVVMKINGAQYIDISQPHATCRYGI